MRIAAIEPYIPERVVSFDETMDLFRHYSKYYYSKEEDLERVLLGARKLLDRAGFQRSVARGPEEPFYESYLDVARSAIAKAGLEPKDIHAVIYFGVCKGYREPATAYPMAARLGIHHGDFFDISDACNGFGRSLRWVEPMLRTSDKIKNVLLLSLEFNRSPYLQGTPDKIYGAYHAAFSIRTPEELEWRIWCATVGETGTATVLTKDDSNGPWYFDYGANSAEFRDCAFTLPNYRDFDPEPFELEKDGAGGLFYAFGKRIGDGIKAQLTPLLQKVPTLLEEAKVVVPHSLSFGVYEWIFKQIGVENKAVYPFRQYGNCVSNGVPMGIAMRVKDGTLKRGDRVVVAPTGSGSSFGVISFKY
jgi:3-oxoacyl-[acyl-carrier-protein] synthase III